MSTNRTLAILIVAVLLLAGAFTLGWAIIGGSDVTALDSAGRSYQAWAKSAVSAPGAQAVIPVTGGYVETDSATRSYTAWALAQCGGALRYDPDLDAATRSYMAMAWSRQCRASP